MIAVGSRVRLNAEVLLRDGRTLPPGETGTIVATYAGDDWVAFMELDGHPGSRVELIGYDYDTDVEVLEPPTQAELEARGLA